MSAVSRIESDDRRRQRYPHGSQLSTDLRECDLEEYERPVAAGASSSDVTGPLTGI
jgi:hypothetical protein